MTGKLAEFAVRLANLAEAEGRALRIHGSWFLARSLIWAAAIAVILLGAVAVLCGLTWALAIALGWPLALILIGFAGALVGAVALMICRSIMPPTSH